MKWSTVFTKPDPGLYLDILNLPIHPAFNQERPGRAKPLIIRKKLPDSFSTEKAKAKARRAAQKYGRPTRIILVVHHVIGSGPNQGSIRRSVRTIHRCGSWVDAAERSYQKWLTQKDHQKRDSLFSGAHTGARRILG